MLWSFNISPYVIPAQAGIHFKAKKLMKQPCVYILATTARGTLYIGVTSDLIARVWQHRNDLAEGFTSEYQVHALVYYEMHETMLEAIQREKQLKKWNREWKIKLVEAFNSDWADLYPQICG